MLFDELKELDFSHKKMRRTGAELAVIFCLIGAFVWWKSGRMVPGIFWAAGGVLLLGLLVPQSLRPFYYVLMALALVLGWGVSRILLTFLFYLAVAPIGILTRVLGKNFLDLKLEKNRESYWHLRQKRSGTREDHLKQY